MKKYLKSFKHYNQKFKSKKQYIEKKLFKNEYRNLNLEIEENMMDYLSFKKIKSN